MAVGVKPAEDALGEGRPAGWPDDGVEADDVVGAGAGRELAPPDRLGELGADVDHLALGRREDPGGGLEPGHRAPVQQLGQRRVLHRSGDDGRGAGPDRRHAARDAVDRPPDRRLLVGQPAGESAS